MTLEIKKRGMMMGREKRKIQKIIVVCVVEKKSKTQFKAK